MVNADCRQRPDAAAFREPFDVIVIGGGINGTGIARDATERGLRVLLVEKNDFGGGTSAYASRLIHGGLRYLEHLEFGLVRESLRERSLLLRNAPHLVRPLALGIPVYRGSRRPLWFIAAGLILYDLLARLSGAPHVAFHRIYGKAGFLRKFPGVNPDGLVGGFQYFDAQATLPERICVENALAAREHGAVVLNHAPVTALLLEDGPENSRVCGIRLKDLETGTEHTARGAVVVNAAGPWIDAVLKLTGKGFPEKIGGTKGTHIVVHKMPGGPARALYVEARQDGRPFFILPWQKAYALIGTTDTRYRDDPDRALPTDDEIDYLIRETRAVLPGVDLDRSKVLFAYAGVRPLPAADDQTPESVTRRYGIETPLPGLVSVIGGKLTTSRSLAEAVVDGILKQSGRSPRPTTTRNVPLPGSRGIRNLQAYKQAEIPQAAETYRIPVETVDPLIDCYGSRYREVLALLEENPVWKQPLSPFGSTIVAEVIWAVRYEFARSSADVLLRRTGAGLRENVGLDAVEQTARLIGGELAWSPEQVKADIAAYQTLVTTLYRPRNTCQSVS